METLRYEPCTQFINVSQRTLHICWQFSAMSRITSKVKTVICEQAPNHGSYFAYARLIARVTLNLVLKAMDGGRDASAAVDESITGEGVHRHDGRVA